MNSYLNKLEHKSINSNSEKKGTQSFQFKDSRAGNTKQNNIQDTINQSPRIVAQRAKTDTLSNTPIQKKEDNKTGLPDQLKSGIETLSGLDMSDTRVHYNSNKPAQLQAHAYAQGTNIHIASGQEKHLAHEAWHVVQQKQGRVQPTTQLKGKTLINDAAGLEREADIMGAKALQMKNITTALNANNSNSNYRKPIQRMKTHKQLGLTKKAIGKDDKLEALKRLIKSYNKSRDTILNTTNISNLNQLGAQQEKFVTAFVERAEAIILYINENYDDDHGIDLITNVYINVTEEISNLNENGKFKMDFDDGHVGKKNKKGKKEVKKIKLIQQLPSRTSYDEIEGMDGNEYVTLIRGVHSIDQAALISEKRSAGGDEQDVNSLAPGEEVALAQVGMDDVSPWANKDTPFKKIPATEYTTNYGIVKGYGKRGGIIAVQIKRKYLTKGDVGQKGWMAARTAPIKFLGYLDPKYVK